MQATELTSLPKSVKLTADQRQKLRSIVRGAISKLEAADILGINRGTLDRILNTNRCSPATAAKIDAAK